VDQILYVGVLILAGVNLGLRAHYIDAGGGIHHPLVERIALNQGMGGGLGPLFWVFIDSMTCFLTNHDAFYVL
jgi:hypothetical protein